MHAYLCVCGLNVCVCACMHACVCACVYCACIISCMFCAETHFYHLYFEFPVCFVQNLVLCVKLHVCFCAETQSDVVNFLCVFVQKPSSMCWISYMFLCRNPVLCGEFPMFFVVAETQSYMLNFLCVFVQKPSPMCWISMAESRRHQWRISRLCTTMTVSQKLENNRNSNERHFHSANLSANENSCTVTYMIRSGDLYIFGCMCVCMWYNMVKYMWLWSG